MILSRFSSDKAVLNLRPWGWKSQLRIEKKKNKRHNITGLHKLLTTNRLMIDKNDCKHNKPSHKRHTNQWPCRANRLVQILKSMDLYNF